MYSNQRTAAYVLAGALWEKGVLDWKDVLSFLILSILVEVGFDFYDKWRARRCPA